MKAINIKTIMETINVSENLAGKYRRGVARPSFLNIYLLNQKLKVPFEVWLSPEAQSSYFNDNSNSDEKSIPKR